MIKVTGLFWVLLIIDWPESCKQIQPVKKRKLLQYRHPIPYRLYTVAPLPIATMGRYRKASTYNRHRLQSDLIRYRPKLPTRKRFFEVRTKDKTEKKRSRDKSLRLPKVEFLQHQSRTLSDKPRTMHLLKATLESNNDLLQQFIHRMLDQFSMAYGVFLNYTRTMNRRMNFPSAGFRRKAVFVRPKAVEKKKALRDTDTSSEIFTPIFTYSTLPTTLKAPKRPFNRTHAIADPIRLMKYKLCDLRYLRAMCQYNIIEIFHDACRRYRCNWNVLPVIWEIIKKACDNVLIKRNNHKLWNGTWKVYRNNRLSPVDLWPTKGRWKDPNFKPEGTWSDTADTSPDSIIDRQGGGNKHRKNKKKVHRRPGMKVKGRTIKIKEQRRRHLKTPIRYKGFKWKN